MKSFLKTSFIGLILMLFTLGPVLADSKPDTTSLTKEKVYHDVKDAITGLSQALKVGASHVYEVMVRQQVVNTITTFIIDAVWLGILVLLWKIGIDMFDKDDENGWLIFVAIVGTIIFMIYFICTINGAITGWVNPEYGAMRDIVSFIKGGGCH